MINDEERNLQNKLRAIARDNQYKKEGFNYYLYRTVKYNSLVVTSCRRTRIRRIPLYKKQLKVITSWEAT